MYETNKSENNCDKEEILLAEIECSAKKKSVALLLNEQTWIQASRCGSGGGQCGWAYRVRNKIVCRIRKEKAKNNKTYKKRERSQLVRTRVKKEVAS